MEYKFQLNTINKVTELLNSQNNKVLVADEVGLGKTFIAAGTVSNLADKCDCSYNVLYMASNQRIQVKNSGKLQKSIKNCKLFTSDRITLAPLEDREKDKINLYSSSPGVFFGTHSNDGNNDERLFICYLLHLFFTNPNNTKYIDYYDAVNFLINCYLNKNDIRDIIEEKLKKNGIDTYRTANLEQLKKENDIVRKTKFNPQYTSFSNKLSDWISMNPEMYQTILKDLCYELYEFDTSYRNHTNIPQIHKDLNSDKNIGYLYTNYISGDTSLPGLADLFNYFRKIFTLFAVKFLDINLIILDEFHGYLDEYAQGVLRYLQSHCQEMKILLLSATPYKAKLDIADDEDPAVKDKSNQQFATYEELLTFLFDSTEPKDALSSYISSLKRLSGIKSEDNWNKAVKAKEEFEKILRQRIVRTERNKFYQEDSIINVNEYFSNEFFLDEIKYHQMNGNVIPLLMEKETPFLATDSFLNNYSKLSPAEDAPKWNSSYTAENIRHLRFNNLYECTNDLEDDWLWIPPVKSKNSATKTIAFCLYMMSVRSIKTIMNDLRSASSVHNNNNAGENCYALEIDRFLPKCMINTNDQKKEDLKNSIIKYIRDHSKVLEKYIDINDYCDKHYLKETLEEYCWILKEDGNTDYADTISEVLKSNQGYCETLSGEDKTLKKDGKEILPPQMTAFQSPFYPFLIAVTSAASEGVDLHNYCHRIMHWHIPVSPVEFEQREGRVDRRLSHLVRKRAYCLSHSDDDNCEHDYDWDKIIEECKKEIHDCDDRYLGIAPYWYIPGSKQDDELPEIERIIVCNTSSKDSVRYRTLLEAKNYYRLSFGGGIEADLALNLKNAAGQLDKDIAELTIDLSPIQK